MLDPELQKVLDEKEAWEKEQAKNNSGKSSHSAKLSTDTSVKKDSPVLGKRKSGGQRNQFKAPTRKDSDDSDSSPYKQQRTDDNGMEFNPFRELAQTEKGQQSS